MTTTSLETSSRECVFKTLRLQHDLTLVDLGNRVGVSKQALIRLEQGTFPKPLEPVLDFWVDNYGYSYLQILDAYDGYRTVQRQSHPRLFGPLSVVTTKSAPHPFRQIRASFGLTECAKLLCVPQATLQHFEKKWRTQQSVPKELRSALHDNGYLNSELVYFCEAYNFWRNRQLGRE